MLTIRNASGEPLSTSWLPGQPSVDDDETVDVDAVIVERLADAVVIDLTHGRQHLALPASQWTVDGGTGETVAEVLDRVGGDPARARAELEAEQDTANGGQGRKTLVRALTSVAAGEEPTDRDGRPMVTGPLAEALAGRPYGMLGDYSAALATEANPTGRLDLADPAADAPPPPAEPPAAPATSPAAASPSTTTDDDGER